MKPTILRTVRIWTVVATAVISLGCGIFVSWPFAFGFASAALWSVAGFWVLERVLREFVVPPGQERQIFRCMAWIGAKIGLYAVAAWGLLTLPWPAMSFALGLALLLIVLVAVGARNRPSTVDQPARRGDNG